MTLDIFAGGKEYISAVRASEKIGYASDYIGQLCRARKIPGQLVGRTWYVDYASLLEHKKNRHIGKPKKLLAEKGPTLDSNSQGRTLGKNFSVSLSPKVPRSFKNVVFTYESDNRSRLPELSKAGRYVPPVLNIRIVREAVSLSLALVIALTAGFGTLEKTSPLVSKMAQDRLENISSTFATGAGVTEQLATVSFFDGVESVFDTMRGGFNNLKQLALDTLFFARNDQAPMANDQSSPNVSISNEEVRPTQVAVTETSEPLALSSIRSDLKTELESYVRARIADLREPLVIYQNNQTVNPVVLREQILAVDTRPSITRQSSSDIDHGSSVIARLQDGGTFTNSSLTGATVSGGTGSFDTFTFGIATGTSATTTNFFSTTASSTNLYSATANLGSLTVSGATTLGGSLSVSGNTTTIGQLLSTRIPTLAHVFTTWPAGTSNASDATIYINPASAAADTNIFAAAVAGTVKFLVDAEGDIYGNNLVLAGSTSQGETTVAGNLTVQDHTTLGDSSSDLITITGGLLANASTTIQTLRFTTATGTSATTTNFFSSLFSGNTLSIGGSATSTINSSGDLLVVGSTTLQHFTFNNATGTSATTTNFFSTTASSTNLFSTALTTGAITSGLINSQTISSLANLTGSLTLGTTFTATGGLSTLSNLLLTGSSTLQNFTFVNATGTSATTTNFFATTASSTNLFSSLGTLTNLLVNSSSTLQNLTFLNSTSTNATTTNFFSTTASSTNLFSASATFGTLLSNGSSTLQNFTFVNATGTSATTTNFFSTTASSTNLFSSTLTVNGKLFTVNGAPTLNDWFDQSVKTTASPTFAGLTLSSALSVANGGTGQSSFGQGWLHSDGTTFTASTSPTINYFTATSTTATSTISTGGFAVGTSNFVVQQSSGNVGIGTTGPGAKLTVTSTVAGNLVSGEILATSGNNYAGNFQAGGTGANKNVGVLAQAYGGTTNYELFIEALAAGDNNYAIYSNALAKSYFAGNVGIGTTAPDQPLRIVKAQNATTYLHMSNSTAGTAAGTAVLLSADSGDIVLKAFSGSFTTSGQNVADAGLIETSATLSGGLNISAAGTQQIGFWQNGSEKMRIHTDGNVGIGTTGPLSKLHLVNGLTIASGVRVVDESVLLLAQADATLDIVGDESGSFGAKFNLKEATAATGALVNTWGLYRTTGASPRLTFSFGTNANAVSNTDMMTILSDGNVGIGTTAPTGKLEIRGTTADSPNFALNLTDVDVAHTITGWAPAATYGFFNILNSTAGGLQVFGASDAVGVRGLELNGFIGVTDPTDTVPAIWINGGKSDGTNQAALGALETVLQIANGGTAAVTLLGSGNVGIGTTGPGDKLDIASGGIVTRKGDGAHWTMKTTDNTTLFTINRRASTNNLEIDTSAQNGHILLSTGTGNVGIGTTGPVNRLHVLDNIAGHAARISNIGNASTKKGLIIVAGTDDGTGTNTAIDFEDADGTPQGAITFTSGTVTYGAFTANHDVSLPEADNEAGFPYGTLVCLTNAYVTPDASRGVKYDAVKCTEPYAKNVLGAYAGKYNDKPNLHQVYVLGDGHILVNGENGNIEIGDSITTSSIAGQGMKATEDGMTIGVAQENYTFSSPTETKLVAVQYGLREITSWNLATWFDDIWSAIVTKLADAGNGIGDFFANRVRTKELCVSDEAGETCITKSQLDTLLAGAGASSQPTTNDTQPTTDSTAPPDTSTESTTATTTDTVVSEPAPAPEPAPEPIVDSTASSTPTTAEPVPEPTPEPISEPAPEPAI
ncbi:MAG: hypothetical protein Q7R67_00060 [bacterium]|nr:hypothetical protein [bacterium]